MNLANWSKTMLRRQVDSLAVGLCRSRLASKIIQYLAYQRKRAIRREVEGRLCRSGEYGDVVQRGPFAGLKYLPLERYASCRFEKILGAYEHELHAWVSDLVANRNYATIFNIGAAEGFYSCGLARLFTGAMVKSYESTESARQYCQTMANLNGVAERVEIHATCSVESLRTSPPNGHVLVVMDVDGAERALLDPNAVPWLRTADVLVETHECFTSGINSVLEDRFGTSHTILKTKNSGLPYADYPPLLSLTFEEIYAMVGEDRPSVQDWFLMRPR